MICENLKLFSHENFSWGPLHNLSMVVIFFINLDRQWSPVKSSEMCRPVWTVTRGCIFVKFHNCASIKHGTKANLLSSVKALKDRHFMFGNF